jgi:hypothetical protein
MNKCCDAMDMYANYDEGDELWYVTCWHCDLNYQHSYVFSNDAIDMAGYLNKQAPEDGV